MFWEPRPQRIYADAAAATPISARAKAELVRLLAVMGNPGALHREGVAAAAELAAARERVAKAIGAHSDEIFFTGSGTEANNLALHQVAGHAITTAIEHASVLEPLMHSGAAVTVLPVDAQGLVDPQQVLEALTDATALVSVQLVNSEIGAVQPVREIAKVLRKQPRKIYLHADASQAPLWMDLSVEHLGVDMLTLDAQKICGPKGVGALYIKRGSNIEPLLLGGGQEDGVRSGTPNVAGIGAFSVALEDAQSGAALRAERIAGVRDYLWSRIHTALPDAVLNGPALGARRVANNINVSVPGLDGQMATIAMDALGVAVSTRSACSEGDDELSPVIAALGVPEPLAKSAVRITLLPDATNAHASAIAKALAEAAARYRKG